MNGRKDWFINISPSLKNKIEFATDNILSTEGIGDVLIRKNDDKQSIISNLLYIPSMKSNLLSISQLIERNDKVLIKDRMMRMIDSSNRLIMKAHMSQNRTLRIELDVLEHKCLTTATNIDEWLWNYILGSLNFNDISNLKRKNMVSGIPEIHIPKEVCEECVQEKQQKNSFGKDARSKSKATLEIIYLDVCSPLQVDSLGGKKYFVTFIDDWN